MAFNPWQLLATILLAILLIEPIMTACISLGLTYFDDEDR